MVFRHSSKGGGAPIQTKSEVYDYGTSRGYREAPMTDKWPADRVTRKLPFPKGMDRQMDDRTASRDSPSDAHFVTRSGPSAAPKVKASKTTHALDRGTAREIRNNRFDARASNVGSGFQKSKMSKEGMGRI
jgi:hypothetical protein